MSGTGKGRKLREGCSKMVQTNSRPNRPRTPSRELAIRGGKGGRREDWTREGLEGEGQEGEEEEGRKEEEEAG